MSKEFRSLLVELPRGSLRPSCYFYRGAALEKDRKKNPDPIEYLITESFETSSARPVPQNGGLLRSLCKGKGVLRQTAQKMIYLDVDDQFIRMMSPYMKKWGLSEPPYFSLFGSPHGAHIPVILRKEVLFHGQEPIVELETSFEFEIEGLYSVTPDGWPEAEQVWFLKVRSPELEALRKRYFFTPLPGGHDFHIVVAVKMHQDEALTKRPLPLMRINTAYQLA